MSKHTPTPWYWTGGLTVNASTGRRCYDALCSEGEEILNDELEVRAEDARLIVAAPDLLEACTALLLTAESMVRLIQMEPHGEPLPLWSQDIATAKAVIAKADEVLE